MEYGWIGGDPPADVPSLVVSAAHSALGAVHRFRVHVGTGTVLLHPAPPPDGAGWTRQPADGLDVGAYLADRLDLAGRDEPVPGERWSGTVPLPRYAALRRAGPDGIAPAAPTGCPAELVRALAAPVALGRVEVSRRAGVARATGPDHVVTEELAWVDGGDDGLWTVRPQDADAVRVARGTPAEVAAELAGMVRAAEGC